MEKRVVDPAELEGDALDSWYRRPADVIEAARRAYYQREYDAFFGGEPAPGEGVARDGAGAGLRDLIWLSDGDNRWRAMDASEPSGATPVLEDVRYRPPGAPVRPAAPPSGPRVGPPIDRTVLPPVGGGGFFSKYSPIPNPNLGPAYITREPAPFNSVVPRLNGWFQLGDGTLVRGADEVEALYAEQQARLSGDDEAEPLATVASADRFKDGVIPSASQLEKRQRERDATCHVYGGWEREAEFHNVKRSKDYEAQVTRAPGLDYVVRVPGKRPVKFDGCAVWDERRQLLEAKGEGYASLFKNAAASRSPTFLKFLVGRTASQAQRQNGVAGGRPVDWHVAEDGAVDAFERLVEAPGRSLKVVYDPPRKGM